MSVSPSSKIDRVRSILALIAVVFIPTGMMIWIREHQSTGFATLELIAYPLIFGSSGILIIILIKKYFLREALQDFNAGGASWQNDIIWGVLLTAIYFILFFAERAFLSDILRFNPNAELLGLMLDMRRDPLLLITWFGPVLWIGIALFEEVLRVFMLTTLWKWSQQRAWTVTAILLAALIMGAAHWGQGPYGVVTIAIKSVVAGLIFWHKRRFLPLVYAHALYDGIQVAMLLLTYPGQ